MCYFMSGGTSKCTILGMCCVESNICPALWNTKPYLKHTRLLIVADLHGPLKHTYSTKPTTTFWQHLHDGKTCSRWLDRLKTIKQICVENSQRLWRQLNHCKDGQLYHSTLKQSSWRPPAYTETCFFHWRNGEKLLNWLCDSSGPSSGLPQSFLSFATELPVMCLPPHPSI